MTLRLPTVPPSAHDAPSPGVLVSRRRFCEVAAALAGALAASGPLASLLAGCSDDGPDLPPESADLPTLGGAPDTAEGRTIAALVDVVIPGKHRDPQGRPGGIDVGAPGLFFDQTLPAANLVPPIVALFDGLARRTGGKPFAALLPSEREKAVDLGISEVEQLGFAVQLARLAFYSSTGAAESLGYPGANAGYAQDPDFTFGRPIARPATQDGNLP